MAVDEGFYAYDTIVLRLSAIGAGDVSQQFLIYARLLQAEEARSLSIELSFARSLSR